MTRDTGPLSLSLSHALHPPPTHHCGPRLHLCVRGRGRLCCAQRMQRPQRPARVQYEADGQRVWHGVRTGSIQPERGVHWQLRRARNAEARVCREHGRTGVARAGKHLRDCRQRAQLQGSIMKGNVEEGALHTHALKRREVRVRVQKSEMRTKIGVNDVRVPIEQAECAAPAYPFSILQRTHLRYERFASDARVDAGHNREHRVILAECDAKREKWERRQGRRG